MTTIAAIAGCLAGLAGAVLPGWWTTGSLMQGIMAASFPGSIPTLAPFAGALIASTLVALVLVAIKPRQASYA